MSELPELPVEWVSDDDERAYWSDFTRFGRAFRQVGSDGKWAHVPLWDVEIPMRNPEPLAKPDDAKFGGCPAASPPPGP